MFRKYGLPSIAVLGFAFAIFMIVFGARKPPVPAIEFPPPSPPYAHFIAGAGIIEASSENIAVGTPFNEIVAEVYVQAGDRVEKGDPLFKLDEQNLKAQMHEALASREVAMANYDRYVAMPRPEEVPPSFAKVKMAEAKFLNEKNQFDLFQKVRDKRAISENEFNQRKYSADEAFSTLKEAEGEYDLLTAGAWVKDIEQARAEVKEAEEKVEVIRTDLERSIIRAPISGEAMQVNVRVGENTQDSEIPILFGSVDPLYVRIDIDQEDAWRFVKGRGATAFVRGNSKIAIPLEFVRIEPYIIPKQAFTGDTRERVDTRVLQVLYRFNKSDYPIYVGELLDVYIEAKPAFS